MTVVEVTELFLQLGQVAGVQRQRWDGATLLNQFCLETISPRFALLNIDPSRWLVRGERIKLSVN